MFGRIFGYLADEIYDTRSRAADLMLQALELGIEPEELECDFALLELGLAEETNARHMDGSPIVEYLDLGQGMIEVDCDEDCDDDDA